jgi:hypothetical protein
MRTIGLCLAVAATAQFTLLSTPAFAEGVSLSATATTSTPAAPATAEDGTVMVHINSSTQVTLKHRASAKAAWEDACTSPCDTKLPVGDEYQVAAQNGAPSKAFRLDGSSGKVVLDVSPGSDSKKSTGMIVTIAGGVLVVAGAVVMIAGAKPSSTFPADGTTGNRNTQALFVGGALVFAGLVTGIYGGALWVNGGTTTVEGDVGKGSTGAKNDSPQIAQKQPAPSTPTFVVPLISGTF